MRLPFPANEDRVPGKALEASDGGLAHAFDTTEGGNSIKGGATVLQSIIRCPAGRPAGRAERLSTNLALVATTLSPLSRVEAVANDGSDIAFSRRRAVPVGQLRLCRVLGLCWL